MRRYLLPLLAAVVLLAACAHGVKLQPVPAPEIVKVPDIRVEPCQIPPAPPRPVPAAPRVLAQAKDARAQGLPRPSWKLAAEALRHDAALGWLDALGLREFWQTVVERSTKGH